MDESSMNRSMSESNILEQTSPKYISHRSKRRRREDDDLDLSHFKNEIKIMIESLLSAHEKELKKITPTLTEIKQTNTNIEKSVTFLAAQNEELLKKIEQLENQAKRDKEYIIILEEKFEDMLRTSRKTNIEIKNVPKNISETKEDLINMAMCLSETISCKFEKSDIRDIYRAKGKKGGNSNSPIIIETSSTIVKTNFLKSCKSFNTKYKGKLCAKHLGFKRYEDTPVYVSEQLTPKGARLHFLTRDLAKAKAYKYCWTAYGRVYVRKCENSPIILIKSEAQVQSLMQQI